jgi:hypothetical protein
MENVFYHGTSKKAAQDLIIGKIDLTKGGGELGCGFYTGDFLWVAKSWAANRFGSNGEVVSLQVSDMNFFNLKPLLLTRIDALEHSRQIKLRGTTRTHKFNENVVWSPIIGTTRIDAEQYKFESRSSQLLLNSKDVLRKVI